MKIPENIKSYILEKCKNEKSIRVNVQDYATKRIVHGLDFDTDGMSKTIDAQVSIIGYIERLLTYSRAPVILYINGESLENVSPKLLNKF